MMPLVHKMNTEREGMPNSPPRPTSVSSSTMGGMAARPCRDYPLPSFGPAFFKSHSARTHTPTPERRQTNPHTACHPQRTLVQPEGECQLPVQVCTCVLSATCSKTPQPPATSQTHPGLLLQCRSANPNRSASPGI